MTQAAFDRYRSDAIETMSPARMIVALYERLLLDLHRAAAAIGADKHVDCHAALVHAQDIVAELADSLDTSQWAAGEALLALYRYLGERLVAANVAKDPAIVQQCIELVEPLVAAWREAAGVVGSASASA